ncbi:MAG: NAD(P)-dependent oxidoreductase [Marmoricola sp.]|nr:NAD(P)-dependent oxidoreductase [Marmoricola sp.]
MTTVGVVGLGTMGAGIARRLLAAGYDVRGTNRSVEKADPLIAEGLQWDAHPRAVAQRSEVVLTMVTDDEALATVTEGAAGVIAGLRPGQVYVDMSSVSPAASIRAAELVSAAGARMLDAPVSGSVPQVQDGSLSIMVGGDEQAFSSVLPILSELGKSVVHVGPNGAGVLLKLALNISLAVQALAFSEGLLLAERGGIDPRLAAEVMSASAIGSPMLRARQPLFLDLPQEAWFPIRLMDKDLGLALDEARRLSVDLPTTVVAARLLDEATRLGLGERDIAGVREALQRLNQARP